MHVQVVFVRAQCLSHHKRPQIGTADTNVHHIGDRFAGVTFPVTANNALGEAFHFRQHRVDFRHHIFAIHLDWRIAAVAQGDVQDGAILRPVNFSPENMDAIAPLKSVSLPGPAVYRASPA